MEMIPDRWWRLEDLEGRLWCETSDEKEVRTMRRPGDKLFRLYSAKVTEWREVD